MRAENLIVTGEKEKPGIPLEEGRYVKISIPDQGTGIPEKHLPMIFDLYYSTKERGVQKGMGLGLAAAYSIIKRHDGHIAVESEVGVGTTFDIYLPASDFGLEQMHKAEEKDVVVKGKILVMEDEETLRDLSCKMLERFGYEAELARRLSENGYFPQPLRQAHPALAGLEILQCIPVVIILAFLDLEKNISFSDSLLEMAPKQ